MKVAERMETSLADTPVRICESSPATLQISVVIAVYEDWAPLDNCLRSLAEQVNPPEFEVIVVDDGSRRATPEQIYRWVDCFPLTVLRQEHAGISTARNR